MEESPHRSYRRDAFAVCLVALAAAVPRSAFCGTAAEADRRPNVVFVLTDDQRYDELGCTGHPVVRTPNIDRLAREGTLFENSFVSSASCMPNRTSLLSGQWERRHTIGWNSGRALSEKQWAETSPMLLKRHGYSVAYVGKNHTPGLRHRDFDFYYGCQIGHLGFYPKKKHPLLRNATADTQIEILDEGASNFLEADEDFFQRATEAARQFLGRRPAGQPFFLYVCFNVPHGAGTLSMRQLPTDDALYRTGYRDEQDRLRPPPGYVAKDDVKEPKIPSAVYSGRQIAQYDYRFTPESLRQQQVRICQTVTGVDRVVGRLREKTEELGLADNTIFIYSSDNGILHGEHGYGGKCLLYDPAIRVPLVICDPREPRGRGRKVEELVLSADVAPTILDLCGLAPVEGMQGRSLVPLIRGEKVPWREDFFCESLILLQEYPLIQGVRSRDWKYLRYWPNRPVPQDYRELLNLGLAEEKPAYEELFDLNSDPLEQKNLAGDPAYQERLEAMRRRCRELLRESLGRAPDAPLPSDPVNDWRQLVQEWFKGL